MYISLCVNMLCAPKCKDQKRGVQCSGPGISSGYEMHGEGGDRDPQELASPG